MAILTDLSLAHPVAPPRYRHVYRSPKDFALHCSVRRALRGHPMFLKGGTGVVVLVVAPGLVPDDYTIAVEAELYFHTSALRRDDVGMMTINSKDAPAKTVSTFNGDYRSRKRVIILSEDGGALPPPLLVAADHVTNLDPIRQRDLQAACYVTLGLPMTSEQANIALSYPGELLWAALRPGRSIAEILHRLSVTKAEGRAAQRRSASDVPLLEAMFGYGPAKSWGLELARDIDDWRAGRIDWADVDCGVALSGPPGVGKTIFAKALAKQCQVSLVAASLAKWQAAGHLGDLLKSMKRDFAKAKDHAPSILFIDELDSLGDRRAFSGEHRDYGIQVVNALLECLDGLDGREGVVVVGATNNTENIDPAILRAGRLDRQIEIPLPSEQDRIAILAQQIDHCIEATELEALKAPTAGMSGADLAKAARDARRLARRAKRPLQIDDFHAVLPPLVEITGEHRTAMAIHEVGHTVVGLALGHGVYRGTKIIDSMIGRAGTQQGGAAYFELPQASYRDREFFLNYIAVLLAGLAAEEVCLGHRGDGAGHGNTSDLAMATRLATMIEAVLGLGSTLRHSAAYDDVALESIRMADPRLCSRIEMILAEQFLRAKALILQFHPLVDRLVEILDEVGELTPETVAQAVRSTVLAPLLRTSTRTSAKRKTK